ncbi:hypothetical protein KR018_005303 [Drosophila ironensis]|nr:hypothetical protein KR018_005303 [Drosophila ironensis]
MEVPDFDSRLIALVRSNPSLYEREVRSTPYDAKKKRKQEIWVSIASSLKMEVNTCITRWHSLVSKLRRELMKEKAGGNGSDWILLPKMRFLQQHHHHHETHAHSAADAGWRSLKAESLIDHVHDEEDPLQEAMDEQQAGAVVTSPVVASAATTAQAPSQAPVSAELMKRIEALLQGLGDANRTKAEKRILAYLCKCNLRALNEETIDDIVI